VTEILHAWALAPAAIGTCCLAADRARVRAPEFVASVVTLVAMVDAALGRVIAPVLWSALLLLGAMALAAVRNGRGAEMTPMRSAQTMTVHTAIGMVVMAALLVVMGPSGAGASAHNHGTSAGVLTAAMLGSVAVYAAGSVVAAARTGRWLDRAQYGAMGASTLVMGVALLG
jgi:hypothetical protein